MPCDTESKNENEMLNEAVLRLFNYATKEDDFSGFSEQEEDKDSNQ